MVTPGQAGQLARRFREAIVLCPRNDLPTLRSFPRGSCGHASILLGEYLYEQGQGIWNYAGGLRELDLHSHAWIERDGVIVDITADQFEDIDEPVIVTRDPSWHRQFVYPEPGRAARIGSYDPSARERLLEMYERICAVMAG